MRCLDFSRSRVRVTSLAHFFQAPRSTDSPDPNFNGLHWVHVTGSLAQQSDNFGSRSNYWQRVGFLVFKDALMSTNDDPRLYYEDDIKEVASWTLYGAEAQID